MEGQSREDCGEISYLRGKARKRKRKLGPSKDEGKEKTSCWLSNEKGELIKQ